MRGDFLRPPIDECGETFYGRHTAQHPAAVSANNNEKFRFFKSKENIHKNEVGPYRGFGYQSLIGDPIDLAKGASGKYCKVAIFNMSSLYLTCHFEERNSLSKTQFAF